uniref:Transmembrane 4 superfamily, isoform B n=1 Tax=Drosophila melanogaster TaxID=7227 RepID=Q2MGN3_DROME|nr:transmembrane 4 superfamily, isoform B [Drosophila melanogaster]ABC66042.1 transmembrane 4 superfamily, isoform B [Drosophila melanogaster]|eukprot:NP_001033968.1 transmembrane 4 superfamily, isoform B [Drosophila melanogaster]
MALPKKIKCFKYLVYSYVVLLAVSCIAVRPNGATTTCLSNYISLHCTHTRMYCMYVRIYVC